MSELLKQLAQAKEEAKHTAATGEGGNPDGQNDELPQGASPIEASASSSKVAETASEESEVEEEGAEEPETETLIRIGDQEFKTQAEAVAYAESLVKEKERTEAYAQGIQDALQAKSEPATPVVEPEDNFEERFYADPKGTLKELKQQATQDALALIKQEQTREKMWDEFLTQYPDVRRKDAERVLGEQWETIGKMTDVKKAMVALGNAVRSEYQEIIEAAKPRTELPNKRTQVLSPGSNTKTSVTHQRKEEPPLDFVAQMKKLKG